jgi:hypothetical protein
VKTVYTNISGLNELQTKIMVYVDWWVHQKKTPIPLKEIIINMTKQGIKEQTTIKATRVLITKGYIRRAVVTSNKRNACIAC